MQRNRWAGGIHSGTDGKFDKVTDALFMFVRIFDSLRQVWANPDPPHGSYKKEPTSDKATDALFMFVEMRRSAVQLGLMAAIQVR